MIMNEKCVRSTMSLLGCGSIPENSFFHDNLRLLIKILQITAISELKKKNNNNCVISDKSILWRWNVFLENKISATKA